MRPSISLHQKYDISTQILRDETLDFSFISTIVYLVLPYFFNKNLKISQTHIKEIQCTLHWSQERSGTAKKFSHWSQERSGIKKNKLKKQGHPVYILLILIPKTKHNMYPGPSSLSFLSLLSLSYLFLKAPSIWPIRKLHKSCMC